MPAGPHLALGTVEVPRGASIRDVTLSRVIAVRATFVDAVGPARWPRAALAVRLRHSDGGRTDGLLGRDGRHYLLGAGAGEHRLQSWPHPIAGAPAEGMPITLRPEDTEVEVDIVVQER